jgi:hypothetical protein
MPVTYDPDLVQTKSSGFRTLLSDISAREEQIAGVIIGIINRDGTYSAAWSFPDKGEAPSKLSLIGLLEIVKADVSAQNIVAPAYDEPGVVPVEALDLDDIGD